MLKPAGGPAAAAADHRSGCRAPADCGRRHV